jgi:hypothetical protein
MWGRSARGGTRIAKLARTSNTSSSVSCCLLLSQSSSGSPRSITMHERIGWPHASRSGLSCQSMVLRTCSLGHKSTSAQVMCQQQQRACVSSLCGASWSDDVHGNDPTVGASGQTCMMRVLLGRHACVSCADADCDTHDRLPIGAFNMSPACQMVPLTCGRCEASLLSSLSAMAYIAASRRKASSDTKNFMAQWQPCRSHAICTTDCPALQANVCQHRPQCMQQSPPTALRSTHMQEPTPSALRANQHLRSLATGTLALVSGQQGRHYQAQRHSACKHGCPECRHDNAGGPRLAPSSALHACACSSGTQHKAVQWQAAQTTQDGCASSAHCKLVVQAAMAAPPSSRCPGRRDKPSSTSGTVPSASSC